MTLATVIRTSETPILINYLNTQARALEFATRFEQLLTKTFGNLKIQNLYTESLNEALKTSARDIIPHVVVVFSEPEGAQINDLDAFNEYYKSLHAMDRELIYIYVCATQVTGALAQDYFARGIHCLIHESHQTAELDDSLREILSTRLERHIPRVPRTRAQHSIQFKIASLEQAIVASVLNIGVGGMFVRTVPAGVEVGDEIQFDLEWSQELGSGEEDGNDPISLRIRNLVDASKKPKSLSGRGEVAWVRRYAESPNLSEGIGLKFTTLTEDSARLIEAFVLARGIKSDVPTS